MKYRVMGQTGLKVSEIAFGCGNVGGLLIRGRRDDQVAAIKRTLKVGINYFDTAPQYGNGASETNLGQVLAELRPQDIIVATKMRLTPDDLKDTRSAAHRSLETSLKRLGRDRVDILWLHTSVAVERGNRDWADSLSIRDVLGTNGVADAFASLRTEKMVRFLGFTGLGETPALHEMVVSGRFDLVQAYFNLLNPSAGYAIPPAFPGYDFKELINRAADRGMGVAAIRVLAGGALGGASARTGYAAPSLGQALVPGGEYGPDEAHAGQLRFLVSPTTSLPQAAIRFPLGHPGIATVLVGFSSLDQIEEAVRAATQGPLPEDIMPRLQKLWAAGFDIGLRNA